MQNDVIIPTMHVNEAAALLSVPAHTIYRLVKAKEIPYYKLGGRVMFAKDDLLNWIKSCRCEPRAAEKV